MNKFIIVLAIAIAACSLSASAVVVSPALETMRIAPPALTTAAAIPPVHQSSPPPVNTPPISQDLLSSEYAALVKHANVSLNSSHTISFSRTTDVQDVHTFYMNNANVIISLRPQNNARISSVELHIGTDAQNYFEYVQPFPTHNPTLRASIISFGIKSFVDVVGTPRMSHVKYVEVILHYDAQQADFDVTLNRVSVQNPLLPSLIASGEYSIPARTPRAQNPLSKVVVPHVSPAVPVRVIVQPSRTPQPAPTLRVHAKREL